MKIFLAHSKHDSDAAIQEMTERLVTTLEPYNVAAQQLICVIPGRDDFDQNFKTYGSWEAWADSISQRIDHATRTLIYSAIVVPHPAVGMATARMIATALRQGMLVLYFDGTAVHCVDSIAKETDDLRQGWRVHGKAI